jgi:serine/threonine-protein phosphatase 2A regulatory subunit A
MPIFRALSQDDQDTVRVLCLESLIPMAAYLSKEENQVHTLGTLLAAGEDKSWKVRLCFAKNFSQFATAFGPEITDKNLIQTFTQLLSDGEMEVKNAAVNSLSMCIEGVAPEKIGNFILPKITQVYADSNFIFKAGLATSLAEMAVKLGKELSMQKIVPIVNELLKDDSSEVKLRMIE